MALCFRLTKKLRGKLQVILEKIDHGHHVLRAHAKNAVLRMYEKFSTFLRIEALSNNLRDFGLGKSLDNLDAVRHALSAVTDRFSAFEAQALNVHVDFPLFQALATPTLCGKTRIPGIKIHDTRMLRLMEVLLHTATQIHGWRTASIHQPICDTFALTPTHYTLTQLRYDLRKMKGHGLIQRHGNRYAYRLTDKGTKVALMFVLFHKRVCGPLANSLFNKPPQPSLRPATKFEAAYRKADQSIQRVIELLAAGKSESKILRLTDQASKTLGFPFLTRICRFLESIFRGAPGNQMSEVGKSEVRKDLRSQISHLPNFHLPNFQRSGSCAYARPQGMKGISGSASGHPLTHSPPRSTKAYLRVG